MGQGYSTRLTGAAAQAARVRQANRQANKIRTQAPLGNSSISAGALRSGDFDGTGPASPGTMGWWLGSAAGIGELIVNDIILRDGIIGNDALTHPVDVDGSGSSASGFNITATPTTRTSLTLSPPSWCDKAVVLAIGNGMGLNSAGTLQFLTGFVLINGINGAQQYQPCSASGGSGSITMSAMRILNPGTSILCEFQMWSQGSSFGASASNLANLDVIAVYLRA